MKTAVAAALAAAAALLLLVPRALEPRDFVSDEAAKISETYYFRLVTEGRFSDPAWFTPDLERANPPVGKYVFGAAVRLAGAPLADTPILYQDATPRYVPPPGREEPFRQAVGPARAVSAVSMALLIGVVVWMSARLGGRIAGAAAFVLLWRHYLTMTLGVTAIFDALQALFIVIALSLLAAARGNAIVRAALAGLAIALAFQTRLNGILALVPALILIAGTRDWTWRTRAIAAATMLGVCGIVSIAVNPFYWAPGPDHTTLPLRIVQRVQWQLHDARTIVSTFDPAMRAGLLEKSRFSLGVFGSGLAGKAILLGALIALLAAAKKHELRVPVLAVLAFTAIFVVWLPLLWDRYAFPPLPLLAWVASLGWAALPRLRQSGQVL